MAHSLMEHEYESLILAFMTEIMNSHKPTLNYIHNIQHLSAVNTETDPHK